jgi:hypothetical protein
MGSGVGNNRTGRGRRENYDNHGSDHCFGPAYPWAKRVLVRPKSPEVLSSQFRAR